MAFLSPSQKESFKKELALLCGMLAIFLAIKFLPPLFAFGKTSLLYERYYSGTLPVNFPELFLGLVLFYFFVKVSLIWLQK